MSPRTDLVQLCLHAAHLCDVVGVGAGMLSVSPHLGTKRLVGVLVKQPADHLVDRGVGEVLCASAHEPVVGGTADSQRCCSCGRHISSLHIRLPVVYEGATASPCVPYRLSHGAL